MKVLHIFASAVLALSVLTACETDKELNIVEVPVEPYQIENLWMVGNATPADWNIDNPVKMTKVADNTFEYQGTLNEGEFKCPMEPGNWGGAFIMPTTNGTQVNHTGVMSDEISLMPNGNPDNKWVVTQAGNYKVTIDGNKHRIHVQHIN